MESQGVFRGTIPIVDRTLDLRAKKHNLIISNITNMDTPNYKALDMVVEEDFHKIMRVEHNIKLRKTHEAHLSGKKLDINTMKVRLKEESEVSLRGDGNTVDIDKEMVSLAENNFLYNALAQIIGKNFQGLKGAIKGDL